MPKAIYDNFLGGLTSYSERFGPQGTYAEGRDVDPHRKPGFIMPGWAESSKVSSTGGVLGGLISSACINPASNKVYAIDLGKVYEILLGTTFTSDGNWPHATTSNGWEVFFYHIAANNRLFYVMDANVGMCDIDTPTFDDDWLSTVPANGATLTTNVPHVTIEWQSMRWIANGQYLGKLDGQTGANGTWTAEALDLGKGWEITTLFSTQHYIGVCAWYKMTSGLDYRTNAKVFMWDGTSSTYNYEIPIEDNRIISALNDNGKIYLITEGREFGSTLRQLTETGGIPLRHLKTFVDGTATHFSNSGTTSQFRNTMDIFQNRVLITGCSTTRNAVFAFGRPDVTFPEALIQPYSSSDDPSATGAMGFVGHLIKGQIFISAYDETDYHWMKFAGSSSTNALWKGRYTDLGQKVRVNYVKFYFQPLVSGDSVTPTLDIDYGTSVTLKDPRGNTTISHTNDGGITQKKFNVKRDCHSFRPVIDWDGGGVAFSKIIVDYDFITDV
jgi:hypothetical protein